MSNQGKQIRAWIYARVSTTGKGQDTALQTRLLEATAEARGWTVVQVLEETASGAKDKRPIRAKILQAARRGQVDVVMVYKLDRWGRSLPDLSATLAEFQQLGVNFFSHTEALDFSTPSGRAMAGLLGVFAEFERDLIRERVQAGVDNARAKGVKLGRPRMPEEKVKKVLQLLAEGKTWRAIQAETKVSQMQISRIQRGWLDQNEGRLPEAGREVAGEAVRRILAAWDQYRNPGGVK